MERRVATKNGPTIQLAAKDSVTSGVPHAFGVRNAVEESFERGP
jgi:hypothetical protein